VYDTILPFNRVSIDIKSNHMGNQWLFITY